MILYLLKSVGCLALLLLFYHVLLKKEKMYTFNRFYLLGSIVFSFLVPLTTITTDKSIEEPIVISETLDFPVISDYTTPIIIKQTFDYSQLLMGIYIIISCVLLIRFARNLFKIIKKIKQNEQVNHKNAILVLVDDKILPHTFWNYIFINKNDYYTNTIEEELFTHELTHVTQKHTLDVLIIEFIQALFWINPLFIFLKQCVQLNHEFLADESVINIYKNTFQYQYLLLNKAAWKNEYYLTSNLNYSLTKKRLEMMTIQSSPTKILLKKLAVIPLLIGFIFLFAERIEAQEIIVVEEIPIKTTKESVNYITDYENNKFYKEYVYSKSSFTFKDKYGKKTTMKYSELTTEEKKNLLPPPPLKLKVKKPTKKQFEDLKNSTKYAVWIDGKVVKNKELNNYNYTDFTRYSNSFIYKNARSKRFPQEYQAHLETKEYFNAKNQARVDNFLRYLKDKHNVEVVEVQEVFEEKPKKNKYIDSPIPKNTFYKQHVSTEAPFMTTTIKVDKEAEIGTVKDIRLKLKDINALKISYKDTTFKKTSATKAQMKEYESIIAKRKKTNIFKVKEINKIKEIYKLMSDKQKESVVNVNDFISKIPILTPKPDWVFTYQRLAYRIQRTTKNRKANIPYLKEIYTSKMTDKERKKVTAPKNILPPPPPKNHLDQVIDMAKKGATFYYEGKVINSDKAIALLKKNKNLNIHSESTNYNNYKVWISKTPIKK